jgi:hypothetical protein
MIFILTGTVYSQVVKENCYPLENTLELTDGVKILKVDEQEYMIAVGSTSNSKSVPISTRISSTKARRYVSEYVNGTNITSQTILKTGEVVTENTVEYYEEFTDKIVEEGSGFVQGMQLGCHWISDDNRVFYVMLFQKIN